jgi:hypothetical protein
LTLRAAGASSGRQERTVSAERRRTRLCPAPALRRQESDLLGITVTTLPPEADLPPAAHTAPDPSASIPNIYELGVHQWARCRRLLDSYEEFGTAAVEAGKELAEFPGIESTLRQIDKSDRLSGKLAYDILSEYEDPYDRYTYAYSLYTAARLTRLRGFLDREAGNVAFDALQEIIDDLLENVEVKFEVNFEQPADWVATVGEPRLREIAEQLGDSYLRIQAYNEQIRAARQRAYVDEQDKQVNELIAKRAARYLLEALPKARNFYSGYPPGSIPLRSLDAWEEKAREVLQS